MLVLVLLDVSGCFWQLLYNMVILSTLGYFVIPINFTGVDLSLPDHLQ
jgi:hypothetical protein